MRKHFGSWSLTGIIFLFCNMTTLYAASPVPRAPMAKTPASYSKGIVAERANAEEKILPDYFSIAFFKPTYFLPYYYTASPDNAAYQGNTPNNESLKHAEVKYQFSVKVPLWKDIHHSHSSLYFAYTQLSYWQLYNHTTFMRENDYEPEIFVANEVNWPLFRNWQLNFLNVGVSHQSNGTGNDLQRSWNRAYVEAVASSNHWMISFKPWYIIAANDNNDNIGQFLGYDRLLVAFKFHRQVISLETHNIFYNTKHATGNLTWSFPIVPYIKGYVEVFSGYGQSLVEYNHRTNSAGIGVALSDWV